jgi:hypothetical protein
MMNAWIETNPDIAIAVIVSAFLLIISLIVLVIWQFQKVRKLEYQLKPKYGFLGKAIVPVLVFGIFFSTVLLINYSTQNPTNQTASADTDLTVDIRLTIDSTGTDLKDVEFSLTPKLGAEEWADESFDIFWTVTGEENFSFIQSGVNEQTYESFIRSLPAGEYQVQVIVSSQQERVEDKTILIIE